MRSSQGFFRLFPLFLVIAIDGLGLGILFPILSDLLINNHRHFLPMGSSELRREMTFGITIGIYMIAWFFGSAMLGDLSDAIGRKKSLLICLLGASIGYFISGFAILYHSLLFLIVGRLIAGFTAGSQPIAQAAIIDVSGDSSRAGNIGYVLLAVSIGFIAGPFVGGVFSDKHIVSWFNDATPLFLTGLLSLFGYVLLLALFKETEAYRRKIKIRLAYPIQTFIEAFKSTRIRLLSIVLLLETIGWAEYYTFISQFLIRRFHYSVTDTSFLMVALSIGFSIGFAFLVNPCAHRFNLKNCVVVNMIIAAIASLVTILATHVAVVWVCAIILGASIAVLYSLLLTIFSNQVGMEEQGWVMGITNSVSALSFGLTVLFSGFAADWNPALPIYLGCAALVIAAILLSQIKLARIDSPY